MSQPREQTDRARELRKSSTPAERILWSQLRGRRLSKFKFRRQVPIGPFFVDFACIQCKVIVEVDGEIHEDRSDDDAARTAFLNSRGWVVLRFWNGQVYDRLDEVVLAIEQLCRQRVAEAPSEK